MPPHNDGSSTDASGNSSPSNPSSPLNSSSQNSSNSSDASGNALIASGTWDSSGNFVPPVFDTFFKNETITQPGLVIHNQEGLSVSGDFVAYTRFDTVDASSDIQIQERLVENVDTYNDVANSNNENSQLLSQIKDYASKIQCSDFHGKGTIDDYTTLFTAASRIANETKSITLDVDIDGFNEFSQAADDLSALFSSFIVKLQNVNIINDTAFLTAIVNALKKIYNLSEVFGRFKKTIFSTTTIQFPKSSHETKLVLEGVMDEIRCAMRYVGHFVAPDLSAVPVDADLSVQEKNIISEAVATIDNWNVICEHGISIAMDNNPDVIYITQASNELKQTTNDLKRATNILRNKFAGFNLC
jgi:hypothetical protein